MASGRTVLGCILLLLLGFLWAPIWMLTNGSKDSVNVHDLFAGDEVDAGTLLNPSQEPPTQSTSDHAPKRLPTVELQEGHVQTKTSVLSKKKKKPPKTSTSYEVNPTVKSVGRGDAIPAGKEGSHRYNGTVQTVGVTVGLEGQAYGNTTMDYGAIQTATTTTSVCSQMTLLRNSTFRWIAKICQALKRQPVYLRAGLLIAVGLASLLVTLIAYKLMCPKVYNREGVEKVYDMEDSWLIIN
ncbi:uncharacterized protein LOC117296526 [Asterias rubens]|uniref:uncharacterized protein LOC117296526 n=1 Tax=Asterias rubens TaxID=7604 RepID=UPI0014551961|nr:uncharacterized protein LOC117296526 [Asterias rubens]